MQVQSTIARTIHTLNGYLIPATVNQRTELNDLPIAASVYMRLNEGRTATDTVLNVFDAMRDSNAVVVLYADGNGIEARVIWPDAVSLTKDNHITCHGYCTLRKQHRTFRLDRMISCHSLSTPDDCEEPDAVCGRTQQEVFDDMQRAEVARALSQGRAPRAMND